MKRSLNEIKNKENVSQEPKPKRSKTLDSSNPATPQKGLLPSSVLIHVFDFLKHKDSLQSHRVCKTWHDAAVHGVDWKHRYWKTWLEEPVKIMNYYQENQTHFNHDEETVLENFSLPSNSSWYSLFYDRAHLNWLNFASFEERIPNLIRKAKNSSSIPSNKTDLTLRQNISIADKFRELFENYYDEIEVWKFCPSNNEKPSLESLLSHCLYFIYTEKIRGPSDTTTLISATSRSVFYHPVSPKMILIYMSWLGDNEMDRECLIYFKEIDLQSIGHLAGDKEKDDGTGEDWRLFAQDIEHRARNNQVPLNKVKENYQKFKQSLPEWIDEKQLLSYITFFNNKNEIENLAPLCLG
eukprot:gb/GECH01005267.1/.p1 GENE.gb/GECH01005267.1/~~gb/GECH01005267.1/.p1  ORF type:complete len:353 (+),score=81.61 gb/GECH01005267.1/:1-1059(+)